MRASRLTRIDDKNKCSCKGYNLDKLLQPNILTILAKQSLHGYLLIQELEDKGIFYSGKIDKAGVYRTLNLLEERGLVRSEWDLDQSGPAKKIYSTTEAGLDCLVNWVGTLENYRNTIDEIIEEAKKIKSITKN